MKTAKPFSRKSSRNIHRATAVLAGFHPLSKTIAGVLVAMQKKFVKLPEWYRRNKVRELAMEYYQALRQVLRESSPNQRWLARCCHCKIFF
jgi:hypothetical protein